MAPWWPRVADRRDDGQAGGVSEVLVRPMRPADVPVCERLSAEAFLAVDRRTRGAGAPEPRLRPPDQAARWNHRTTSFLATDAAGCWVADLDGEVAGFATSLRREGLWVLATYAVRADLQGRGIGRAVLDAALTHSRACLRGMLSASADPGALRRYLLAGFTLHPAMTLEGVVDTTEAPQVDRVREGSTADRDLLDSLDRATRGYAHGSDHDLLAQGTRLLVTDTSTGSGYVYALEDGSVVTALAATNRRTAARLLWTVLAHATGPVSVPHVTAANAWAVEVGTAARLTVRQEGFLALKGMNPPAPYLHHGALL